MVAKFSIESTKELLTARCGLAIFGEYLDSIDFSTDVNRLLPRPKSNNGIAASHYVSSLVTMLHAGGKYLEDIRLLQGDEGLKKLMDFHIPSADAIGDWLRRMGNQTHAMSGLTRVNNNLADRYFSALAPDDRNNDIGLTLDIDASGIESGKYSAKYTYKGFKGYMPIIGHVGQFIVGEEFREGNIAPADGNLEFIKHCLLQMPEGHSIKAVRADSASYQASIINFCKKNNLKYAIGGKITEGLAGEIQALSEQDWQVYTDKHGVKSDRQITSMPWSMEKTPDSFTLVIIRSKIENPDLFTGGYKYHVVATNITNKTAAEIMQWYSQRGEDSENRIKELKAGFAMEYMPCGSFEANAAFFRIGSISYNLALLLKIELLGKRFARATIATIRLYVYQIPAKVIRTARKLVIKTTAAAAELFQNMRLKIKPT